MPKERKECFLCGRICYTERHHVFGGTANRRLSEEDGMVVDLCPDCHNRPPNGVHFNKARRQELQSHCQAWWEGQRNVDGMTRAEAHEAFIKRYGKNYL